jgi:type VI secretion system protein ImpA
MASPEILEFAKLLGPIAGDNPAGMDLRTDSTPTSPYYAIKDARSKARAAERRMPGEGEEGPPPDWRPVVQTGVKVLTEKSKDLEVAAYLIEGLIRINQFAGLRDGFHLVRELIDKFWDKLYPLPDEEGLTTRVAPLTGLNGDDAEGTLIAPINNVPITESPNMGRLTPANFIEAQAINKILDPKAREKKIATGVLTPEKFDQAVAETPAKFYVNLMDDLTKCQEEFTKLTAVLDQRCGGHSPPASSIRGALEGVLDTVKNVAKNKLASAAPAAAEAGKDGAAAQADGAAGGAAPGQAAGVIRTRDDAYRELLKVADFFRRTEPHNIVSYTLEQVVRWGQMPLPDLLNELIPDEGPRKNLFKQVGIKPPEPPPKK